MRTCGSHRLSLSPLYLDQITQFSSAESKTHLIILTVCRHISHHLHERWISWFLASLKVAANCEMLVVWIARHIGPFWAAEHLTHWTFISLGRLIFVFARRLQRARLRVLYSIPVIYLQSICNTYFFLCCCTHTLSHTLLCVCCVWLCSRGIIQNFLLSTVFTLLPTKTELFIPASRVYREISS
jgi:hypothetical protein